MDQNINILQKYLQKYFEWQNFLLIIYYQIYILFEWPNVEQTLK